MGAISGVEYIRRIDQLQSDVWIHGEQVKGNISEHFAYKGVIKSQAALYDLQLDSSLQDVMTYRSPGTGDRVGTSYMIPQTKEDLEKRRLMVQEWARTHAGMLGRSPDYMNTALMSFAASKHLLEGEKNCFPDHIQAVYERAREKDLSFTHAFINPQVNRSAHYFTEDDDDTIAAKVVDRNDEGLVVRGGKLLATQGGITDEMIVYSTANVMDKSYAYAFSIPTNTEGLRFICRESFSGRESTFDYPLSSRFEEVDALVVFDDVVVPWERVFYYDNIQAPAKLTGEGSFTNMAMHQVVSRQVVKLEFVLGVAQQIVDTINISEYQHVQEKLAEMIMTLESMKALLLKAEIEAEEDHGVMIPALKPLYAAVTTFQRQYPKMTEFIQLLGASGMISIPTEKDFEEVIRGDLDKYLQAKTKNAEERVKLFRLAWDLCMSSFGTRQSLYEKFFFGDPIRLMGALYFKYDKSRFVDRVSQFLNN
ncbi:4-hydroxyphenylacetate 3-monooxygenase, oxygenase component [Texcoconibacillus texcoconensis]|uniref:4-hydroxyphenylacetate 3-monooxygenase n=1 Tax=Texcoconibacillus texcoconensis TaxID=1095777 RepID=A0A840QMB6_9BACI|nr:4-hydroxyphenylacetate 3-monooxygenase, oxygenase component [Texcoconibacillus texcoconensis]MBB5172507.1 4-hydroxyphenylacetate 3-monooxygenase [Texcoconibacillus texcoconensis]